MIPIPFKPLWNSLLSLVYPERCQLCLARHATPEMGFVCQACRQQIRPISGPACHRCGLPFCGAITQSFECTNCRNRELAFSRARSAVEAVGPAREAIHRYKYSRALWLEPFFQSIWVPVASADLASSPWSGIVPVPLHSTRLREREFNQAERLARMLGKSLQLPVANHLVLRIAPTHSQTRLTREERSVNVRRAFAPACNLAIGGTRWIVVDDVLTTGSTTDAVAHVLRSAGAAEVVVWTVARGV